MIFAVEIFFRWGAESELLSVVELQNSSPKLKLHNTFSFSNQNVLSYFSYPDLGTWHASPGFALSLLSLINCLPLGGFWFETLIISVALLVPQMQKRFIDE